jgi:hypothetical protein
MPYPRHAALSSGYGMWRDSQTPPPPMTIATIAGTISQVTT